MCLAIDTNSQDLEPRAYAALPKNLNALFFAYGLSKGNVLSDPSLPIKDLSITVNSFAGGYLRTFGVGNKLGRVQVALPFVALSGSAELNGSDTSASRAGFADAKVRLGINLIGAPALEKKDFRNYTQKTIVGISLVTSIPIGLYKEQKLVNIGANRWAFKPEIGVSKFFKPIYLEAYAGVWFFTTNDSYRGEKKLEQDPVFALQVHGSYYFKNRMMLSLNTTWFDGGAQKVDGVTNGDKLDNWRVGATWAFPLARAHTLKLQFHVGAFTNTGYDYTTGVLAYQYIF